FLALLGIRNRKNRKPLVFRRVHIAQSLRVFFIFEDQLVLRLRCADFVKVDALASVLGGELAAFLWSREAIVIEAVALPGGARKLNPLEPVRQRLSGRDFQDVEFLPIGASARDCISSVLAIAGKRKGAQLSGPVLRKLVWVDKDFRG